MDTLTSIIESAKLVRRRIVLSEGEDQRVIEAAFRANNTQLADPILIGDEGLIKKKIRSLGSNPNEVEIAYLGLLEEYLNQKLGSYLLSSAIKNSFAEICVCMINAISIFFGNCSNKARIRVVLPVPTSPVNWIKPPLSVTP